MYTKILAALSPLILAGWMKNCQSRANHSGRDKTWRALSGACDKESDRNASPIVQKIWKNPANWPNVTCIAPSVVAAGTWAWGVTGWTIRLHRWETPDRPPTNHVTLRSAPKPTPHLGLELDLEIQLDLGLELELHRSVATKASPLKHFH